MYRTAASMGLERCVSAVLLSLAACNWAGGQAQPDWDQVDNARALIQEPGPFQAADLKGRLPK